MKKKISVVIPTFNEEANIDFVYGEVVKMFAENFPQYDYDILFIDNHSTDRTRELIRALYDKDPEHVKAIFNARNFGQGRSHFYGLTHADGDCAILLHADLQNPISAVIEFIKKWEQGAKVVIGIYDNNMEGFFLKTLRTLYYKIMHRISSVEQIEHFSDFELLDKEFLQVLKGLHDPSPYLRGIISEFGFKMERVSYTKNLRKHGRTHANFFTLYDFAMNGVTAYSKGLLRAISLFGMLSSAVSFLIAIGLVVEKLILWDSFQFGIAGIAVGLFLMFSLITLFLGILGEYVLAINIRVLDRPLVIEECRLGF